MNKRVNKLLGKQIKLGHQAPRLYKINRFNYIEIDGDFAYCKSHNFMYNTEEEKRKLYDGKPCYYTDIRFINSFNTYKRANIKFSRWKDISLKQCIRRTLSCKNIPIGTIVEFRKSWYCPTKKVDLSYNFKIKKENKLDIVYEINDPKYSDQFTSCEFSKELTNKLRENGFIVRVQKNESFLNNMLNTAIAYTGKGELIDSEIEGETAITYGYGKKIGFSSFNNDFMGYSNGCDNILYDKFGEFNKWSQCIEIAKTTPIDEIISILKSDNKSDDHVKD